MNLLSILLQAQPGMGSMLPMIIIFGAFFIYMIWSQKKQEKKIRQYRANLKAGDTVILQTGIYGKIKSIEADGVTIQIRTAVLKDAEGNLITQDLFLGKTIDVKGIVDCYEGQYQIRVFSMNDITIHE